jgi:CMP-N-acetylneuraminic acid synthetase
MPNKPRLAVIPAREGSKRLPGKNGKLLGSKPLIAWGITAALASGCFERVLVSTDSPRLAELAEAAGAWVPFLRPAELASDTADSLSVLLHAVDWVEAAPEGFQAQNVALIQPTSPFLRPDHIREAVALFDSRRFTSLSSMRKVHDRPEWMFQESDHHRGVPRELQGFTLSSAQLEPLFLENGALYLMRRDLLRKKLMYDLKNHGMYLMSPEDSVDIDTQADWDYAEFLLGGRAGSH